MSKLCKECGAKCCQYFCFEIDEPDDCEEFEDVRWYLAHENVSVHIDEDGDWYISLANRCRYLGPDGRCADYDNRPLICRTYDMDGCDHTGGDYAYQEEFTAPEQIEAYAKKTLGEKSFTNARDKQRAKLEKKHLAKMAKMAKKAKMAKAAKAPKKARKKQRA